MVAKNAIRLLRVAVGSMLLTACAGMASTGGSPDAGARARRAAAALERERFAEARKDLLWLAKQCAGGEQRRRSLLLLAVVDLDPASPSFSPSEAAWAAAAYITSPGTERHELPVARALYRIAAEFGGFRSITDLATLDGESAPAMPDCPGGTMHEIERPLPAMAAVGPTTHLRSVERSVAARADSVTALRAEADSLRQELQRIADLLTNGVAPGVSPTGMPR